jgi:nucleoside-diphosphate-sugar epimerase
VYASSVAAYGFHRDNPVGMGEDWPTRPADRLFYAQEKAELEEVLRVEAAEHPGLALYTLRPCIVLGPHTVGAKDLLPGPFAGLGRRLSSRLGRLAIPIPALVPDVPVQFVHEDDVGQALLQCVVAAGPPGAYNIAGDGVLSALEVAREFGFIPISVPARPVQAAARVVARLPFLPAAAEWVEALSHPAIMDTTLARTQLGWEPRFSGLEALRVTLRQPRSVDNLTRT